MSPTFMSLPVAGITCMTPIAPTRLFLDCSSPESIMEPTNRTPAGDQYSLGCTLYFALAGRYPFADGGSTFCGAEGGMLIFDCLGDVYSCWEQAGHPDKRTGTYGTDGLHLDRAAASAWLNRFPGTIDECLGCPYALIHKSGCADVALRQSGSIFAPACESFKEYFPRTLAAAWQRCEDELLAVGND